MARGDSGRAKVSCPTKIAEASVACTQAKASGSIAWYWAPSALVPLMSVCMLRTRAPIVPASSGPP